MGTGEFGRRRHTTPPGTYHLNWHARVHVSTENRTWIMPWYFNFASGGGLGLHQYSLPGKPASHGCVRMLAVRCQMALPMGRGWTLAAERMKWPSPGHWCLLVGRYDFASPQPWLQPKWWAPAVHRFARKRSPPENKVSPQESSPTRGLLPPVRYYRVFSH